MEIGVPFQVSNKAIDISSILDIPEKATWPSKTEDMRSNRFKTHEYTRSLIYRWSERSEWPILKVSDNRDLYKYQEVLDIADCVNTIFRIDYDPLNIILAELEPGSEIHEHADTHPFFSWARRIHVPLVVPVGCVFRVEDHIVPLTPGIPFEISNTRLHSVINESDQPRYHLVLDYQPTSVRVLDDSCYNG